jgi:hypothetical protein
MLMYHEDYMLYAGWPEFGPFCSIKRPVTYISATVNFSMLNIYRSSPHTFEELTENILKEVYSVS